MIEEIKEFLEELKKSEIFKKFKEKNQLAYNSSISKIQKELQIDYYDPNTDKITSFTKRDNKIISQESEVFRKEKIEIPELKLDKIKITLKAIEDIIAMKYQEIPTKKIFILQQKESPIWNITYLTQSLNILNMKINAETGQIIEEKIESAMNFQKK
ncbi:hypothetical protein HON86_03435 [Candidatus Woesearchaeota archaeon]|jgi:hypothetical protein|nr:hypothetical protein [Candidatus Woesearchaeota archaeon]MBT6735403.1 hypothetical protein [Candidatus Woesearchaeota archaeon]MBT7169726.1 hypothetical protein [Candidatus Woesearchaeota archaeon]MBT7474666.1 hypothetical protein [Candidatus Woesearchaeota archaeon]